MPVRAGSPVPPPQPPQQPPVTYYNPLHWEVNQPQNVAGGTGGSRGFGPGPVTTPCESNRAGTDIVGRFNDMINCYAYTIGQRLQQWIVSIVLIVVLLLIMILAARELIKEGA